MKVTTNFGDEGVTNPEPPTRIPFEFLGTGSEYFKIWLVNIILSILTLGIYSAWAKVRSMPIRLTQVMVAFDSVLRIADRVEALTCRDF